MSEGNRHSFPEVKAAASGLWPGIVIASGVAPEYLTGRHRDCPGCGGKDRFRWIDKQQDGFFICNGGGDRIGGDGFRLLEHVHGWSAGEALRFVADYLGLAGREVTQADRNAWQQRRVLEALAHEIEVLRIAIADIRANKSLSETDAERLRLAVKRTRAGLDTLHA